MIRLAAVWSSSTGPSGFVGVTVKPTGRAPNFKGDTARATGDDAIMREVVDTRNATDAARASALNGWPGSPSSATAAPVRARAEARTARNQAQTAFVAACPR